MNQEQIFGWEFSF